jgi:ABC-2 type transport system permease protein
MPGARRFGIVDVALREVAWIWRDKVALLLVVVIPLIAFAILSATFSNAVIRDLRVDVVDQDKSRTSEAFVLAISAAPSVTVATRSPDLNAATHALRSGDAIAAVYIPQNFERDIMGGRRPQVVIFFNKQFFTPGNVASSALQAAISAAVANLPAGPHSTAFTPGPHVVEQYVLTNPALNYAQFLLRAILPTVLHIVIALSAGYAVGSEFGSRDMREWLATAGDGIVVALVGKLAPYFGIFLVMMAVGLGIIHGIFEIPFSGDPVLMGAGACLLIIAYLSLGALIQLLVRNLPFGLSLTGIICSPAFGFAGVGFPVLAMNAFSRGWGALLPLRWYIQILFDQAARGVPAADSAEPFMMLGGLAVLYFGLAWVRLRAIGHRPLPKSAQGPQQDEPSRIGIVRAFTDEFRGVVSDRMAFGLIVLAPIVYGVFYPQPYLGQLIKDIPIAVVDDDSSTVSHTIIQAVNADEAVKVTLRPATLADAQAALARREVFGILSIPLGTEREVLKGDQARLPAYVDSTYFLLYNRTLQGIQEGVGAVATDLAARSARPDGSLYRAALAQSSPVEILNQPLFNPTGGYGSYIVPAAFMLIIQQTRLMGSATVAGVAYEQSGRRSRRRRSSVSAVIGQSLAQLLLALPGLALFLVVLPRLYGFSATNHVLDLIVLAIPFILSVSLLGQFVGSWFKRRETAVLLFVAISLPMFFLVGVAWPVEAIPPKIRSASFVLPSTFGIDGLVRVNQMGATLTDVSQDWMGLWVLTGVYAILAVASAKITGWRMPDAR